jgi:hypothetical protein
VKDKVIRAEAARRIITLVFIVLIIKILRDGYGIWLIRTRRLLIRGRHR